MRFAIRAEENAVRASALVQNGKRAIVFGEKGDVNVWDIGVERVDASCWQAAAWCPSVQERQLYLGHDPVEPATGERACLDRLAGP